jgi:hypothetical protein
MPGLAKFLAAMNVLAAGAFIYLAAIDWQKRSEWSYEVFRRELAVNGLPLNEADAGWRIDRPIRQDLSRATIDDVFKNAGKNPVYSQIDELNRVKDELKKEIEALPSDKEKRARLKQIILDQATTADQRIAEAKPLTDDAALDVYWKRFEKLFADVAQLANPDDDKHYDAGRAREAMAHLLYNLSSDPNQHQRVMAVVGLRPFAREAELQANNLREMANRLRNIMVDDRTLFEAEFGRLVQRILGLAEAIEQMNVELAYKKDLKERAQVELNKREADLKRLAEEVGMKKEERRAALDHHQALEAELFKINAELGLIKEQTEILERELRGLERAGGR